MRGRDCASGGIATHHQLDVAGLDDQLVAGAAVDDLQNLGDLIVTQAHMPPRFFVCYLSLPSYLVAVLIINRRRKAFGLAI